jgi:ATP-dependent DNA helicase RecG
MLDDLLKGEEGKTLEFKEDTSSLKGILRTIVAFANTSGGVLVIGVKDKTKEIVGVKDVLLEEERIANIVADSITPLITPTFQFHTWRNRDLLIITIHHAIGPYYLKAGGLERGVYVRLGSTNRMADQATVADIQRMTVHQSFDQLPNLKTETDDIDFELAKKLFAKVSKKFTTNVATSLELLVKYQGTYYPSNAAILLFGKDRKSFFPNAIIRCGRFAGQTKTEIIDQKDLDLSLPEAVEAVIEFITKNTSIAAKIGPIHRVDIPEYPALAIREAIINAIVHADYSFKGSNIQVAIFSDRIEIINPGALPYGLSFRKALDGISQLRNRAIGHVFRELGLIEQWGSGFKKIIESCEERGLKAPKFEELDYYFRVTLYKEKKSLKIKVKWQQEMVEHLKKNREVSVVDATKVWGVTSRTATTRIKKMIEIGILTEVGTGPFDPKKKFVLTEKN